MSRLLGLVFLLLVSATTLCADPVTVGNGSTVTIAANSAQIHFSGGVGLSYIGDTPSGTRSVFINTALSGFGSVNFAGTTSSFFRGNLTFTDDFLTGSLSAYNDFFFTNPPIFTVTFNAHGYIVIDSPGGVRRTTFTVTTPEPTSILLLTGGMFGVVAIGRRRRK